MIKKVCDACDNWEQEEMSHLPVPGWDVITIKSDLGEIGATFDLCPDCAVRLREGGLIEGMIDILTDIKNKRNNTTPGGLILEVDGAKGYFPVEYIKHAIKASMERHKEEK